MTEVAVYVMIFIAGLIFGTFFAFFVIGVSRANRTFEYHDGFIDGYEKGKQEKENVTIKDIAIKEELGDVDVFSDWDRSIYL